MAKIRYVLLLSLVLTGLIGLNVSLGLAQGASKVWSAGPGTAGTASGITLKTASSDSPVAAPISVTDGSTTKTATQMPTNPNESVRYLYFDVDTAGFPSGFSFARVDVEFLDESSLGGSLLRVQYDATTGAFANSDYATMLGSGRFQTATFHLTDVKFLNGQNSGLSDFRLLDINNKGVKVTRVTVTASTTSTRPTGSTPVEFNAGANPSSSGLDLKAAGDGIISFVTDGPTADRRTAVKVSTQGNAYFDVDNMYMSNGSFTDAIVDVTYYDKGYGSFYIVFDARSGLCPTTDNFCDSFGPSTDYQSNNVVYMQNSDTWKTYRFHLSNVSFGNRLLGSLADFKIVHPQDTARTIENQGYRLSVEKVTVTRSATPLDKTGEFEGNYSGFGSPAFVWTQLGTLNRQGHGLFQDETIAGTTATTVGGKTGRTLANGSAYFNINDNYLKNGADSGGVPLKSVLIGVEYYDSGSGSFTVDYEATSGTRSAAPVVTLAGSNTWKRASFYITDGKFNNGLSGGNDFLIKTTGGPSTLVIRDVVVTRTVGENRTGAIPSGFTRKQKIAGVHHFPVFDGYRPTLWEKSTDAPAGTGADAYTTNAHGQNVVNTNYSYRNIATHKKDLTDMRDAGFDMAIVWFTGNTIDLNTQGVVGIRQMVAAAREISNPPKFALLVDPVHVKHEAFLRNKDTNLDLNNPATVGQFVKIAEDFFSLVPRSMWATIEGRPVIAVYYQGSDVVDSPSDTVLQAIIDRFEATHGVKPYIVPDRLYDPNSSKNLPADDYFSWGAAECESCVQGSAGFAQRSVFEIGPGFNDGRRIRDRENGAFYERGWDRAAGKGNHMVWVDTFNYWVEGGSIAESRAFGRKYLDISKTKIAAYKARDYSSASSVRVDLGATTTYGGVMQDEVPDGLTEAHSRGGRTATGRFMSFSVHDSFVESTNTEVRVTVEYLDSGVDIIDVKVDGAEGEVLAGRINVKDSNSGQFRTASFTVNAFLGNRLTFANDIRLDTDRAGAMVIKSLSVERISSAPTPTPTATCQTPTEQTGGAAVPTPGPNVFRSLVPLVLRNYCAPQ